MSDIYASVSTSSSLSAGINNQNKLNAIVGNNTSLSASVNPNQSIIATGATLKNLTGTIFTPAQPNITSLGTLTSLTVSGDVSVSNSPTSGNHLTNKTYVDAQLAITSSSLTTHEGLTNNPHSVTATQVGLGNVTNESKATMFSSPTFTGNPQSNAVPGSGDHLTNKTYVDAQVSGMIDGAPAALDTLNELSAALNDSPSQINNILTAIGERLVIANNLSDLNDASSARTNLGLGNVTNESKATMFTNPTFTGNLTTSGNIESTGGSIIANDATIAGNITSSAGGLTLGTSSSFSYDVTIGTILKVKSDAGDTLYDTLKADSSNTRVGIGNSSPERALHIKTHTSDDEGQHPLRVEGASSSIIEIKAGDDSSFTGIDFGDSTATHPGSIVYNHSNNNMTFDTNDATRMTIDSSGNIGINKTPDRTLDMDGHFRILISPENRISGQSTALIKGTDGRSAQLRVVGPVTVTHDLFKVSGDTNGFADNSNHFHDITRINRIMQQPDGEVKNIERVQEQYYAIESNLLRGSNAAFWNWHRVSRSIDNTSVSLTNLTGWNVSAIQNSSNRNNSAQVPFAQSESTTFTFTTSNPFTNGDLLQIKINIDFAGAIVAATLFAKVTNINGLEATVVLYGGNYKSTDEVALGTTQTALTTNFSVNKIDTTNKLTLTGNTGLNAAQAHQRSFRNLSGGLANRTGTRVIRLTLNHGHNLEVNDVITIITNGSGNYKNAEVAFVKSITTGSSHDFVYVVYGRIFDSDPSLPNSYSQNNVIAILKGTLDGLHRINAGDTLMNFNSDNAGRYKSFHIGPGTEVDGNCISIGKNVYNNIDKSIRIAYDPEAGGPGVTPSNHLLITPTYTETLKPLSTTGIQAVRVSGEAESVTDLHYDSANHFFRDFDSVPNDMMVIKRRTDLGAGGSIGMVGINNDSPSVALHVNGQAGSDGTTNEVFRAIGSGLFTSKNNIALHLKVDTDNSTQGARILKLQQDSTNESSTSSERMNLGFIGSTGGGTYTDSTNGAGYIEVENNKPFEIATGNNKSLSITSQGYASFRNRVAIGRGIAEPFVALHVTGDLRVDDTDGSPTLTYDSSANQLNAAGATFEINKSNGVDVAIGNDDFYVDMSTSQVGIGTRTPNETLHVEDSSSSNGTSLTIQNAFGESPKNIKFRQNDTIETARIEGYGRNNTSLLPYLAFHVNQTTSELASNDVAERMRIDSSGNVGIGTTSPGQALDITGNLRISNTLPKILLVDSDNDSDYQISNTNGTFAIYDLTNNENRFILKSSGRVGIGSTAPTHNLDVLGNQVIRPITYAGNQDGAAITFAASDNTAWDSDLFGIRFATNSSGVPSLRLRANGGDKLTVKGSGVGIGTTDPDKLLVVEGANAEIVINDTSSTPLLRLRENGTTKSEIKTSSGSLIFTSGGTTERIRINSTGEVGIGKTAATGKELDVQGDIQASGDVQGNSVTAENSLICNGDAEFQTTDITGDLTISGQTQFDDTVEFQSEADFSSGSIIGLTNLTVDTNVLAVNGTSNKVGINHTPTSSSSQFHVDGETMKFEMSGDVGLELNNGLFTYKIGDISEAETGTYLDINSTDGFARLHGTGLSIGKALTSGKRLDVAGDALMNNLTVDGGFIAAGDCEVQSDLQLTQGAGIEAEGSIKAKGYSLNASTFIVVSTTSTLASSTSGLTVILQNTGPITITLPTLTAGHVTTFISETSNDVTFVGDTGVTVNSFGGANTTAGQFAQCQVIYKTSTVAFLGGNLV